LGWFYGFKLYIFTNDQSGIIEFMITKGNVDDPKPFRFKAFIKKPYGKLLTIKAISPKTCLLNFLAVGHPL